MSNRRKKPSDKEIIFRLLDGMFEADIQSNKDADNYIRKMGAAPDSLVAEGTQFLNQCKAKLRRSKARQLLEMFREVLREAERVGDVKAKKNVIRDSLSQLEPDLASAFYRKLEKLDEQDLKDENKLLELWSDFLDQNKQAK